jgi:exodeoxyribonuclease-3
VSDVARGLAGEPDGDEARWVEATVGGVRVVSTYVPNGRALDSPMFATKLKFLDAMRTRAAELAGGPAVIAGDVNVCPADLDVWDTTKVHGATHVTPDERSRLRAVLDTGFVDAFRHLHPDEAGFTWWDYRAGHFPKGFGLRIDLVMLSSHLSGGVRASEVQRAYRKPSKVPGTKPSDHAPLLVDVDD